MTYIFFTKPKNFDQHLLKINIKIIRKFQIKLIIYFFKLHLLTNNYIEISQNIFNLCFHNVNRIIYILEHCFFKYLSSSISYYHF